MTKKAEKYLIDLSGGGDRNIVLVGEEIFNWIFSEPPKELFEEHSMDDVTTPEIVKKANDGLVNITSGSWENDRAMICTLLEPSFYSTSELTEYCNKNNIEIVDEYQGCIY